jgi:Holliday junction DNA helicase RuvB
MRLPKFTFVGATTRQGLITKPLQDRFGATYHLDFYSIDELVQVIKRSAKVSKLIIDDLAANELAQRAKRTPRIANNLLLQSRDFALSFGIDQINQAVVLGMMEALEIDNLGLTRMDKTILETIALKFNGGPVGLSTLAATLAEEVDVLERVYEPYLLQAHLIERTMKGRVITSEAREHLGLKFVQAPLIRQDI